MTSGGAPVVARGGPAGHSQYGYYSWNNGQSGQPGLAGHPGTFSGYPGSAGQGGSHAGGGFFIADGSVTLHNVTVAFKAAPVLAVTASPSKVGASSWTIHSSPTTDTPARAPSGADYDHASSGGGAVANDSLFGSDPTGVTLGGGSLIGDADLADGLASNGGPTETIALLAGSPAIGAGQNPIDGVTLFTDQRGYIPNGAWNSAPDQPGNPAPGPIATLSADQRLAIRFRLTTYTFSVTYAGPAGITPSSLAGAVVTVNPPDGGNPIAATVVGTVANGPTDPWGDARSFTVNYTITLPNGSSYLRRRAGRLAGQRHRRQHDPGRSARFHRVALDRHDSRRFGDGLPAGRVTGWTRTRSQMATIGSPSPATSRGGRSRFKVRSPP